MWRKLEKAQATDHFGDQLHMLLPNLSKIQGRSYGEALALLDTAQAVLEADRASEPLAIHGVAS